MVRRKRDRVTLASSNPGYSQSSPAVRMRAHACHVPVASVLSDLTLQRHGRLLRVESTTHGALDPR